ncbi:MAG: arginine decarboxylase [Myxococcota bacterium]|jgi:arginine decarboxylase
MNPIGEFASDVEALSTTRNASIYGLPRRRSDLWNRLRDAARRLSRAETRDGRQALSELVREFIIALAPLEQFYVFPGAAILAHLGGLLAAGEVSELADTAARVARIRSMGIYRRIDLSTARVSEFLELVAHDQRSFRAGREDARPYFEVLLVDEGEDADQLRRKLRSHSTVDDDFRYESVVVSSFEDALLAAVANPSLGACVVRFSFPFTRDGVNTALMDRLYTLLGVEREALSALKPGQRTARLGALLHQLRPNLDLYRVTDGPIENVVGGTNEAFRRIFYEIEDHRDLHASLLHGVGERFATPFFDAVRSYAERPTAMFHALPVSRGRTIYKSNWISDFGNFYGSRLFMAETSATTGGLDSLLQPVGSLKEAQRVAARAFGSDHTYFVTNGTSTANKIVLQALTRPADLVLLSHDCHKSHPYACILSGAHPIYLDGYPLRALSMYGGIPLATIKRRLLRLRRLGQLHRLRLLLLTNITFDGIAYDPYRVMREVLAIHPDIVFVWDEAWFAYGRFSPLTRPRTAMDAAQRLEADLRSEAHRDAWAAHELPAEDDEEGWMVQTLPDPSRARVRVYATHSTHKTLTALRQASMIHVYDADFKRTVEESFHEAYMMHTSTSPNYQILASLDVGRRQAELEGYALVGESVDFSFLLRERIQGDPVLQRYFRVIGPAGMVPASLRPSGIERYILDNGATEKIEEAWASDEFTLDPTRVTVHIGRTGMDGDTFKLHLMDDHAVHINKTSRNSVLFLVHIGSSRGTIAHLIGVLSRIAIELDRWLEHATPAERTAHEARVQTLTRELPPLPDFSAFHPAFVSAADAGTGAGDMRQAYYLAYRSDATRYLSLEDALAALIEGKTLVAARFVTPYPPGFPVLMPGQVVTEAVLSYLIALDTKEIHGLSPTLGLCVFCDDALASC